MTNDQGNFNNQKLKSDAKVWMRDGWLDNSIILRDKKLVFSRFGHLLLIIALLGATGTHWVMLQSVAWATMLADNARTDSFPAAIEKTFDGRHPCPLCKQIAKGRQSERKSDQQNNLKELEFCNEPVVFVINPPDHFVLLGELNAVMPALIQAPPVPPPRSFLG